jgi:hypothetical protein
VGALAVNRETLAVTEATVAANLHQAGNVLTNLTTEVTLGRVISIDKVTDLGDFFLGEIRTRVEGLIPVSAQIFLALVEPMPYK